MDPTELSLEATSTALMVIDVQERLFAAMAEKTQQRMEKGLGILVKSAELFSIPCLVTEHYPEGLGPTIAPVREALGELTAPRKLSFSACGCEELMQQLRGTGARTVILCGMEAHVCVLQTAAGLVAAGFRVWVAEDAICSRAEAHWRSAIRLLENVGAVVAPIETMLFLLLGDARHPAAKAVNALIK